jgi:hypothetical protein
MATVVVTGNTIDITKLLIGLYCLPKAAGGSCVSAYYKKAFIIDMALI